MSIQGMYQDRLCSAEEAVSYIEPGEGIVMPINPGEPPALLKALPTNGRLRGNTLFRMLPGYPVLDIDSNKVKQVSIFLSGMDRKPYSNGVVDLLPNHFSDIPSLIRMSTSERVIMVAVSPMDEEGYFSLGTSVSYVGQLLHDAKTIILEVNENMPRTFGEQ